MILYRVWFFPMLLFLQSSMITIGALAALRDPQRAASLYRAAPKSPERGAKTEYSRESAMIVLAMVPFQFGLAFLMAHTAYALLTDSSHEANRSAALMLAVFSGIELSMASVRFHANTLRGTSLDEGGPVLGTRGVVSSGVFCVLYALGSVMLRLS